MKKGELEKEEEKERGEKGIEIERATDIGMDVYFMCMDRWI